MIDLLTLTVLTILTVLSLKPECSSLSRQDMIEKYSECLNFENMVIVKGMLVYLKILPFASDTFIPLFLLFMKHFRGPIPWVFQAVFLCLPL